MGGVAISAASTVALWWSSIICSSRPVPPLLVLRPPLNLRINDDEGDEAEEEENVRVTPPLALGEGVRTNPVVVCISQDSLVESSGTLGSSVRSGYTSPPSKLYFFFSWLE
jgi:hypothetical protein